MNKRINKETKAIADAHIQARISGNFDTCNFESKEQVIQALREGKVIEHVMNQVEVHFCTITSTLMARMLQHDCGAYKQQVYKGFKALLQ